MPTFKHGKNTKVAFDELNATEYLNDSTLSATSETASTSVYGDGVTKYVLGLRDGTVTLGGFFEGSTDGIDQIVQASIGTDDGANFMVLPAGDGDGPGSRVWFGQGDLTNYETSSPVTDVVSVSIDVQVDSGINAGVYLREAGTGAAFQTVNAGGTQNSSSVDNAAATTLGGVGQVHVMANSLNGVATVKVQHSTDNATFVDLITFTGIAAGEGTSEQVEVSGTVNRYLRGHVTTGGSTGTAEIAVAFKRN